MVSTLVVGLLIGAPVVLVAALAAKVRRSRRRRRASTAERAPAAVTREVPFEPSAPVPIRDRERQHLELVAARGPNRAQRRLAQKRLRRM